MAEHLVTVHDPVRFTGRRRADMRFDIECTCGWTSGATYSVDAEARAALHARETGGVVLQREKPA